MKEQEKDPRYVVRRERSGDRWLGWLVIDRSRNLIVKRFAAGGMEAARHEARRRNWQAERR